jgi:cell division protein FtsL
VKTEQLSTSKGYRETPEGNQTFSDFEKAHFGCVAAQPVVLVVSLLATQQIYQVQSPETQDEGQLS